MRYHTLGKTNLRVSAVCLGSMTWGHQNTQEDAFSQMDYAIENGINFIDTAEMYSVPTQADTCGLTETIIGHWLAERGNRDILIIATKVAGPSRIKHIRGGKARLDRDNIRTAVEGSLKRLQTDYLDLFQLHWPNRITPHFNKHAPNQISFSDTKTLEHEAQMLDILKGLKKCVDAGKIRFCGLSDDTTWGINTYLKLSERHNLPRMVSIQNEFSLLHTMDWPHLIENCVHEDIAYLPWSPLAGGMLSGKYSNGARPEGSRWTIAQRHGNFRDVTTAHNAVEAYAQIAKENGFTPAQLALAWCNSVDGVTSTIIGASSMAQLKDDIEAFSKPLNKKMVDDINHVLKTFPAPF